MSERYKKILKISEKWEKADKKSIGITVLVVFLFLASILLFLLHIRDITKHYRNVINEEVVCQAGNSGFLTIANTLFTAGELENAADSISYLSLENINSSSKDLKEIITKTSEIIESEGIVFTDVEGNIICSDLALDSNVGFYGVIEQFDDASQFCFINNSSDIISDKGSFFIVEPVNKENVTVGYVIGIVNYESMLTNNQYSDQLKRDEVIIDNNLNAVALIREDGYIKVNEPKNFFDEMATYISGDEYSAIASDYEEHMNAKTSGYYISESGEEDYIFAYQPFNRVNNWCIVSSIPASSIEPFVRGMLINSLIAFLAIAILLVVAGWIIVSHIRGEHKRVSNLEFLDGLTGAPNRNSFTRSAEELLKENKDVPYYVSCYDIVNFRIINETYGHERSDEIIKALAEASKSAFGKNEVFGRLNADVFVALVINDGEDEDRIAFIEEKVAAEAKKVFINHPIKIKRGYFEVTNYMESVSRMIDKANIARKFAASDAKMATCKYTDALMEDAIKSEKIESQMNDALKNGEFVPYLQAKFDMERNHVNGAEALVRWKKPDGSLVPPGDFIPLFERNGFVEKIDFYMLEEICKYIRRMIDEGRAVYPVSVNQSRYLLNDPEYVSRVRDILLKYEIPVGLIELELTETVFFHEKDRMIDMMNELKNIHVNLSIDDFGSGYSSFNLLKDVPFDVLKIDRAFLSDTEQSDKGRWILREIVEMAHGLGMKVICEGVETKEQIEMLLSIKCTNAQGFYYARPVPMEEYIEKYNVISG